MCVQEEPGRGKAQPPKVLGTLVCLSDQLGILLPTQRPAGSHTNPCSPKLGLLNLVWLQILKQPRNSASALHSKVLKVVLSEHGPRGRYTYLCSQKWARWPQLDCWSWHYPALAPVPYSLGLAAILSPKESGGSHPCPCPWSQACQFWFIWGSGTVMWLQPLLAMVQEWSYLSRNTPSVSLEAAWKTSAPAVNPEASRNQVIWFQPLSSVVQDWFCLPRDLLRMLQGNPAGATLICGPGNRPAICRHWNWLLSQCQGPRSHPIHPDARQNPHLPEPLVTDPPTTYLTAHLPLVMELSFNFVQLQAQRQFLQPGDPTREGLYLQNSL